MSDAINYLLAVRPEAIGPYFEFLKNSGKHLDNKTRFIISVITKVDNQTERGFKQYLNRALREGATPNEIIDALMVAFPTLGLTKIIWAVDQIMAMNLPEFTPEALLGKTDWVEVCKIEELKDEVTHLNELEEPLFVYKKDDDIKVFEARCSHQGMQFMDEDRQGCKLMCPLHGWEFDLKTGDCTNFGSTPLKQYEHRIADNTLQIKR